MIRRHLILRVFATVTTAAAVAAPGAAAMPTRDAGPRATANPNLVDAAAHAATMRGIGERLAGEHGSDSAHRTARLDTRAATVHHRPAAVRR